MNTEQQVAISITELADRAAELDRIQDELHQIREEQITEMLFVPNVECAMCSEKTSEFICKKCHSEIWSERARKTIFVSTSIVFIGSSFWFFDAVTAGCFGIGTATILTIVYDMFR
jgi:hypothetical protein